MLDRTKPPYHVPLMAEIAKVKPNGLTVISTFAGCGGSSLGYRMAGFKVLWASEFVDAARKVYEDNAAPGTVVDGRDIREVDPLEVLRLLKLKPGELDVLDGSPPCASFSTAGKREQHWGEKKKYCVAPETPVLLTDLTWRAARDLVEGNQVVAFDEETGGKRRKFRPAAILETKRLLQPCVRITTSDGASVVCSADHRWLFVQGRNLRWRRSKNLKKGHQLLSIGRPWKADETYDGGYLSGIFDGEGCVSKQKKGGTRLLGFAQKPGAVLDRAVEILKRTGAPFGIYPASVGGALTVNINGGPFWKARVLGIFRPVRLIPKAGLLWDGVDIGAAEKVEITGVEFLGEREVIALSTSAKTFIADGLLSHNSDKVQRTDDLFFEYVRFLKAMQPRAFVAENVSGLVKGTAKGYFLQILAAMKACGYRVEARLLDAQWLGVPQARQRIIFHGVRNDLDLEPAFPTPLPYRYSVRDALPWLGGGMGTTPSEMTIIPGDRGNRRRRESGRPHRLDEPLTAVMADGGRNTNRAQFMVEGDAPSIDGLAIGREWDKLDPGQESDKFFNLKRAPLAGPCQTVTAQGGGPTIASVTHPTEKRKFSIAELKRICAFSDDFILSGSYAQQWERLGRAVPPLMMFAIAATVARTLKPRPTPKTPARGPRSRDRSTSGSPPTGAGRTRTPPPNEGRRSSPDGSARSRRRARSLG